MDILFPEVGLDHPTVSSDLARRAGGDLLPEGQHDDAMRERHDRAHVVLDEKHGDATRVDGAHQADHGVDLRGVEPRHHVVEEEEAGEQVENRGLPRSVRTDQPQHLALGHGEIEAADGEQSAEALLETRDFEKAHALRRTRRRSAGYAPWGRNSTTVMRRSPYTIRCAPVHPPWAK